MFSNAASPSNRLNFHFQRQADRERENENEMTAKVENRFQQHLFYNNRKVGHQTKVPNKLQQQCQLKTKFEYHAKWYTTY